MTVWMGGFVNPEAAKLAMRMEELKGYGRHLGLTDEQIGECIERENMHARSTSQSFRWNVARGDMLDLAFKADE